MPRLLLAAEAAGFALFFPVFSTFQATWGLYLEGLSMRLEHRGTGIGLALLRAVAAEAVRRGGDRVDRAVLDGNTPALAFYCHLGARAKDDRQLMRLEGDALRALATG